jgi:CRISPR-associated endonuclease Csn1
VFGILQRLDLLPSDNSEQRVVRENTGKLSAKDVRTERLRESDARDSVLRKLDARLREKYGAEDTESAAHLLAYRLRARAAREPLAKNERHEFGRALYHLSQRRGFLSNRKAAPKPDEDESVVKKGIGELASKLQGRTLGQYFATLNPLEQRIRQRWTSREMYIDEFRGMWDMQSGVFGLSDDDRNRVFRAIFFQRPLKSQKNLVGRCTLEPERRRAPIALPIVQRFRILQNVNHLRVRFPDGEVRELTLDEKQKLYAALDVACELSFADVRKSLGFKKKGTQFSIEESGEKKLIGNRTHAKLEPIFGQGWSEKSDAERDGIVLEVLHFQKPAALKRRAMSKWGLSEDAAERLCDVGLEADYAQHSVAALGKLVEKMSGGMSYSSARKEVYPEAFRSGEPLNELPPVLTARPNLRNPAVCRALTELRKVVNAIVRLHGRPEEIRIELARDLKKSREERTRIKKSSDEQSKRRAAAVAKILEYLPGYSPGRGYDAAIEKVLLAEECNKRCPFTGKDISMATLIGSNPQFDVAHIFPRRYLDDSFINKTLCYHEVNRHRMHDLTPYQAFGGNEYSVNGVLSWQQILSNVGKFNGTAARAKLERFKRTEPPDNNEFVSSQLNDTRHNTVAAAEYLGLLYGGRVDPDGVQRIYGIAGGITALLRGCWRLFKSRDDHRHHALDAIVVALTNAATVSRLQRLAEQASRTGTRLTQVTGFPEPWPNFANDVEKQLDAINVSFRVDHRLGGPLHAETNYSPPIRDNSGRGTQAHHVRKELWKLSRTDITGDAIVDPVVRRLVQERFAEAGGGDPKKVFAEPASHPYMTAKDGRHIPIHKVRLRVSAKPRTVGEGIRLRHVASGANSNHHAVIVAVLDAAGKEISWEEHVVSRLEANARQSREAKARCVSIIQRDWGNGRRFKFSIMPNDSLSMLDKSGKRQLYRVLSISAGDHEVQLHTDARSSKELKERRQRIRMTAKKLFEARAHKVVVSPLGDVVRARE